VGEATDEMDLSVVSRSRAYKVTTTELAAKIQKKEDEEQLREKGGQWGESKAVDGLASRTSSQSNRTAKTRTCNSSRERTNTIVTP